MSSLASGNALFLSDKVRFLSQNLAKAPENRGDWRHFPSANPAISMRYRKFSFRPQESSGAQRRPTAKGTLRRTSMDGISDIVNNLFDISVIRMTLPRRSLAASHRQFRQTVRTR
jgi:hypothetical protein